MYLRRRGVRARRQHGDRLIYLRMNRRELLKECTADSAEILLYRQRHRAVLVAEQLLRLQQGYDLRQPLEGAHLYKRLLKD